MPLINKSVHFLLQNFVDKVTQKQYQILYIKIKKVNNIRKFVRFIQLMNCLYLISFRLLFLTLFALVPIIVISWPLSLGSKFTFLFLFSTTTITVSSLRLFLMHKLSFVSLNVLTYFQYTFFLTLKWENLEIDFIFKRTLDGIICKIHCLKTMVIITNDKIF